MFKLAVICLCVTVVLAQDLDSILLDIYGPDMNTNMIHKNSGEMNTGGANTDYAHPIPIKNHKLMRRQASALDSESCTIAGEVGRCVPYYLCSEVNLNNPNDISNDGCANTIEICCPSRI